MIRVSPSALDGFQYYLDSDLSTKDFIMRLCRLDGKSEWAHAGTALHRYIDLRGECDRVPGSDGVIYKIQTPPGLDIEIPRPQVSEFRMAKMMRSNGEDIILSGIVDAIIGNRLFEWKGVKRMRLGSFIDSWQWRCYLSMDDRFSRVVYHVFRMRINGQVIFLMEHRNLVMQRYSGMVEETENFIDEYVSHLKQLEDQGLIVRKMGRQNRLKWGIGPNFRGLGG